MDIKDIAEIKDISGGFGYDTMKLAQDSVNKLLSEDWILIDTYKESTFDPQFASAEAIHYVLGRRKKYEVPDL